MKKLIGALAVAAFAVSLVAPAGAASTKSGCKGKWTDAGVCSFTYKGGGFSISAEGVSSDPATIVSVSLEAVGPNGVGKVVIMSCGVATGANGAPAACASGSSGGTAVPYQPKPGEELTCTVNGNGTGKYRCISGV